MRSDMSWQDACDAKVDAVRMRLLLLWCIVQSTVPHCLVCICIQKVHVVLTCSFVQTSSVQSQGLVAFCMAAKSHLLLSDA